MGVNAEVYFLLRNFNHKKPAGDTIIGSWISPDGHYAFVEFRNPEEATKGLQSLSGGGVKIMG